MISVLWCSKKVGDFQQWSSAKSMEQLGCQLKSQLRLENPDCRHQQLVRCGYSRRQRLREDGLAVMPATEACCDTRQGSRTEYRLYITVYCPYTICVFLSSQQRDSISTGLRSSSYRKKTCRGLVKSKKKKHSKLCSGKRACRSANAQEHKTSKYAHRTSEDIPVEKYQT